MTPPLPINRRDALGAAGTGLLAAALSPEVFAAEPRKTGLGLVIYDCGVRRRWLQQQDLAGDLFEPLTFLRYCQTLGAGGMQAKLGGLDRAGVKELRGFAEQHSLFIDAIVDPPRDQADLARFEREIRIAAEVGVQAARSVIMPGRRYERFASLEEFREYEKQGRKMAELAAPIVEKHRTPLAIENHKDQRNEERIALFEQIDSEYVGACVDTGNSFALLEEPIETVRALAPWAKTVHLKDQAVQPYADGFLLGDIPLGQGCFDLKKMVEILRKAQLQIRFTLELITRDALRVPCLTEKYWATMPQVAGKELARTLRTVRENPAAKLQLVSSLPLEQQQALEEQNVRASLDFARDTLKL
ncbi:sugar phosphate isomerase/epimerase family protein [Lignipirellula cremea]|uniref:Xylose isomerase-like TIM barrel n=1 Tax=Lignipirellula cremea TaxID=2528010 RepID=A0A518DKP9_9BACT|nr:sugar phosphate isomerase/epimerase family protein [Lignipirellula cremea]QDU92414.1 Xylose isomerase-like TIM barrel [Lignipirellula cremea]